MDLLEAVLQDTLEDLRDLRDDPDFIGAVHVLTRTHFILAMQQIEDVMQEADLSDSDRLAEIRRVLGWFREKQKASGRILPGD